MPAGPLAVTLVEVKGPVPSVRPWVRYGTYLTRGRRRQSGLMRFLREKFM